MRSKYFLFIISMIFFALFSVNVFANESIEIKEIDIECVRDEDNKSKYFCYGSGDEPFDFPRPQINVSFPDNQNTEFVNEPKPRWARNSSGVNFDYSLTDNTATFISNNFLGDDNYTLNFEVEYVSKRLFLDIELDFEISANQSPIWVEKPSNPFVSMPRFAIGTSRIFDLDMHLGYPEGHPQYRGDDGIEIYSCKYGVGELNDQSSLESVFQSLTDVFEKNETDPSKFYKKDFDLLQIFDSYQPGVLRPMQVICNDTGGRFSAEQIEVGAFETGPVIEGEFNPSTIIDGVARRTNIELSLDQPSICYVSDRPNDGEYGDNIVFEELEGPIEVFSYKDFYESIVESSNSLDTTMDSQDVSVEFTCTGLSNISSSRNFSFSTDFQNIQNIDIVNPGNFISSNSENVTIEVPLTDTCFVSVNDDDSNSFEQMQRVDGFFNGNSRYTLNQDFDLDENVIYTYCTLLGSSAITSKVVRLDTSDPGSTDIDLSSHTCSFDSFEAEFSSNDENSGIEGFEYNVSLEESDSFVDGFSLSRFLNINVGDLSLSPLNVNESLVVQARAVDRAGNKGSWAQTGIIVSDSSVVQCDVSSPFATISSNFDNVSNSHNVSFSCEDDGSGCTNSLQYSIHQNEEACTYDIEASYDSVLEISQTSRVCLKVADKAGNEDFDEVTLEVDLPLTCFNEVLDGDETDVDCGGSCNECELDNACEVNDDCSSSYCAEQVCSVPSCTDGIQNQGETDVDCGGPKCDSCVVGSVCKANSDCGSGNCNSGLCEEPSCSNGIQDGDETDVDCGGPDCQACSNSNSCSLDADCSSGSCNDGICGVDSSVEDEDDADPSGENSSGFNSMSTLALVFFSLGVVSLLVGVGLLVYESQYIKPQSQSNVPRPDGLSGNSNQSSKSDYKGKSQSKLSDEKSKKAAQERLQKRREMFKNFSKDDKLSKENNNIKSVKKVQSVENDSSKSNVDKENSTSKSSKNSEVNAKDTKAKAENKKEKASKSKDDEDIILSGDDDVFDKLKEKSKEGSKK